MFGILNLVIPLQIGARDVAFPFLNSLSFWLFVAGAALINLSLVVGQFAATDGLRIRHFRSCNTALVSVSTTHLGTADIGLWQLVFGHQLF